jgi:hypothetical protein
MNPQIIDTQFQFHDDADAALVIQRTQEIPQWHLDDLAERRKESTQKPMGEFHQFASIPEAVYLKWLREGFNPRHETAAKIIGKLKAEGLGYFVTTDRNL